MSSQVSSIPSIDSSTKVRHGLRACFDSLLEWSAPTEFPYERLARHGWSRSSGTPLHRLRRRQIINRLGQGFGILGRKGYRNIFHYYRHMRIPLNARSPNFDRHPDGSLKIKTHVMKHPKWPSATVVLAQTHTDEMAKSGYTIGLWAFLESSDELMDCRTYANLFNGTGNHFFTPLGHPRGLSHVWTCENEGKSTYGRVSKVNRDKASIEFSRERFSKELLPQLDLPDHCHLYSAITSQRYY
jgi:hypothetical protein